MAQGAEAARGAWGSQLEFLLTTLGSAVGMGNVWRFPYLTYRNGGGAFLIPYFLSLFLLAIPVFAIEVGLGQFASLASLKIWQFGPLFAGVGVAMIAFLTILMSYYAVIIAQFIFFLFASMTSELPWAACTHEWNTCSCRLDRNDTSYLNNTHLNCSYVPPGGIDSTTPSEEYYNNHVLAVSGGVEESGELQWRLVLCSLFTWTLTAIILIRGVKTLGKAIYVFTILPYILLTVLLVRGLTLEGYQQGIEFYITPNVSRLSDATVWGDAAVQIFFSTSTCSGALMAMASYNAFNNHILRDSFLVPIANCLTSFFAGFAIYSILGFMALNKGTTVDQVTAQGPGLVFVVYPEALSRMPVAPLWAILFFIMMMCLGVSSLISAVEAIVSSIMDIFPVLRIGWRSIIFRFGVCLFLFLMGLPHLTQGGSYFLNMIDTFLSGFPLLFIGLFEIIAVIYVYGLRRFHEDLSLMLGENYSVSFRRMYRGYFLWTWTVVSPVLIVVIIITMATQYQPITSQGYPVWSEVIGWLVVAAILGPIPAWYLGYFCKKGGWQLLRSLHEPADSWGPLAEENKKGRYAKERQLWSNGHSPKEQELFSVRGHQGGVENIAFTQL